MSDDELIEKLAGMLVRIELNYARETSGPGSRFEGQRLEVVQARALLRRVRQEPGPLWAAAERARAEGRLKPLPRMPSVRPESDYEMHLPEEGA